MLSKGNEQIVISVILIHPIYCSFGLRYVSWYKYLIVSLVFSHLGFWSGNLFLIAPFPDLCLLVPFFTFPMKDQVGCCGFFLGKMVKLIDVSRHCYDEKLNIL